MKALKNFFRSFWTLPVLLKIIWVFCFIGFVCNLFAVWQDLCQNGILLRLHIGFLSLYGGQIMFILLRERMVFVLSLLQAILALITNLDLTFVPALRWVGNGLYMWHGPFSLEVTEAYKYIFVSACFTLELLKTFLMWWLLPSYKERLKTTSVVAETIK